MPRLTVYLDNSSWNQLSSGFMCSFREMIIANNSLICYSQDNLREILSTSDEDKRIALDEQLDDLSAQFIENLGESPKENPYKASFKTIDHKERWRIYEEVSRYSPLGGFGLADLLQKSIGGIGSKSYDAIFQEALQSITSMLNDAIDDLEDGIDKDIWNLRKTMTLRDAEAFSAELIQQVKQHKELRLPELDHVKVANFSGEGSAERLLQEAAKSDAVWVVTAFLSDVPVARDEARKARASRDQILRLSQTLFLLRYKREAKNMKDNERARVDFQGSLTDLDHIANASVCSMFHTSDKAQSQIAATVYDHLNVRTVVCHYSKEEDSTTVTYLPSGISKSWMPGKLSSL